MELFHLKRANLRSETENFKDCFPGELAFIITMAHNNVGPSAASIKSHNGSHLSGVSNMYGATSSAQTSKDRAALKTIEFELK